MQVVRMNWDAKGSNARKSILVTGGTGFVGQHLSRLLTRRGYDVTVLGRRPPTELPFGVKRLTLDLQNQSSLEQLPRKWDAVIHLAGASIPSLFIGPAPVVFNLEIALNLLDHLRDSRVLLVSSCHVYAPSDARRKEADPILPQGFYGLSKHMVEQLASHFRARLDVRIARPFNHLGPGLRPELMVPSLLRRLANFPSGDLSPVIMEGLNSTRDFIDVRDVSSAYLAIIEDECAIGETFNVCTGRSLTVEDVVTTAMDLLGCRRPVQFIANPNSPDDIPYLVGDPARLHAATGWTPAYGLSDSLSSMIDVYHNRGKS